MARKYEARFRIDGWRHSYERSDGPPPPVPADISKAPPPGRRPAGFFRGGGVNVRFRGPASIRKTHAVKKIFSAHGSMADDGHSG